MYVANINCNINLTTICAEIAKVKRVSGKFTMFKY